MSSNLPMHNKSVQVQPLFGAVWPTQSETITQRSSGQPLRRLRHFPRETAVGLFAVRGYLRGASRQTLSTSITYRKGTSRLSIPVLQGRLFTVRTRKRNASRCVNETATRTFFAGVNPVGQVLAFDKLGNRIVGVVRDARNTTSLREPRFPLRFSSAVAPAALPRGAKHAVRPPYPSLAPGARPIAATPFAETCGGRPG